MEYFLLILGFILMLVGIIGSILPALPGPPISWVGILMLYLCESISINYWILAVTLLIAFIIGILDYIIPAKGTKYFGGSKYGIWGTNIGLVVGIFAPIPFGFLIGPFVGALVGELIYNSQEKGRAFKAATGSFIGFLAGTFMKVLVSLLFLGLFLVLVWQNRTVWF
ncbi:DUF456 domain-containing protein [Flavobacterium sp. HXWNR29]|uniref:DUF456 domain-containing protein n=1 Tax=Flavobacterium odoriferum TaxID=2946604 RepID=UPI0021CB148D|nr:DUF456 domain-containing protein [Flavobacterium sp. HXWNR29]MCU4187642.1 DUF456 domain-containing protein [Flavobacterium sp. HXWNR29]